MHDLRLPDASYKHHHEIIKGQETHQKGLLWFVANDPHIPAEILNRMQQWWLPIDEFTDNGHRPLQLYAREARFIRGKFVMTENELLKRTQTPESVGIDSYSIDSHNVQR